MEAARVNPPGYRQAPRRGIARGVIRFVNVMGGRHMALPGDYAPDAPAARPLAAATPPAPWASPSECRRGPCAFRRRQVRQPSTRQQPAVALDRKKKKASWRRTASRHHAETTAAARAGSPSARDQPAGTRRRARARAKPPSLESRRAGRADADPRRGKGAAGAGRAADGQYAVSDAVGTRPAHDQLAPAASQP